jgi:hypothetical protein
MALNIPCQTSSRTPPRPWIAARAQAARPMNIKTVATMMAAT